MVLHKISIVFPLPTQTGVATDTVRKMGAPIAYFLLSGV